MVPVENVVPGINNVIRARRPLNVLSAKMGKMGEMVRMEGMEGMGYPDKMVNRGRSDLQDQPGVL
jgi:hypothetical protein